MGTYYTIATTQENERVAFFDSPTSYKEGIVKKIRGSYPPGEKGNVLIETEDGEHWVKGGDIVTLEVAKKQIAYNKAHPNAVRKYSKH